MEDVANRIQEIIKKKGISNSEMADTIGLPRPILSHILSGRNKPSLAVIQKIAEAFSDIDTEWLLIGTESKSHSNGEKEVPNVRVDTKVVEKTVELITTEAPVKPEASEKRDLNLVSNPTKSAAKEEITQIVHYYRDGTFKVFNPKE